jgi:D-alanine-D-alanine ligase and related ATP-grasp enzymes
MNTPSNFNHINKKRIALFFGGKSSEHEISILSAVQLAQAIDTRLFEIIPVYIDLKGLWYMGASLLDKSFYKDLSNLKTLTRVTLLPDPTIKGLLTIQADGTIDIHQKHPIDCAIFAFHGQHGEDGCMQGLFELAAIPYTGSNVASSAIAMNKYLCKKYLESHGVPTLPSILVRKEEFLREKEKSSNKRSPNLVIKPSYL